MHFVTLKKLEILRIANLRIPILNSFFYNNCQLFNDLPVLISEKPIQMVDPTPPPPFRKNSFLSIYQFSGSTIYRAVAG